MPGRVQKIEEAVATRRRNRGAEFLRGAGQGREPCKVDEGRNTNVISSKSGIIIVEHTRTKTESNKWTLTLRAPTKPEPESPSTSRTYPEFHPNASPKFRV